MSSVDTADETQTTENVNAVSGPGRDLLFSRHEGTWKPPASVLQSKDHVPSAEVSAQQTFRTWKPLDERTPDDQFYVFSKRQKRYIVFLTAWGDISSPLSANIYFPALNSLSKDLKVSNELINLILTSCMIFQGLAPTTFGDLADMTGRRPAYIIDIVIYVGANSRLALQNKHAALFILRSLQSTGSSGTVALGSGVVADSPSSGERGKYMGFPQFRPMTAPAIALVMGGIMSQFLGWRSLFLFLTIMAVVYLLPFGITFPETGRNVVGNGSVPPQGWNMSLMNYLEARKINRISELSCTASRLEKKTA